MRARLSAIVALCFMGAMTTLLPPSAAQAPISKPLLKTGPARTRVAGDLHILAVGVNAYQKPLKWAVNDAREFANTLERAGKPYFQNVHLQVLTAPGGSAATVPTRKALVAALSEITRKASPNDTFVFFFSGYSIAKPPNEQFHLIPYAPGGGDNARRESISAVELQAFLDAITARRQLLIFETGVLSEGALSFTSRLSGASDPDEFRRRFRKGDLATQVVHTDPITANLFQKQVCIIGLHDKSPEIPETRHGIITTAVLEVLRPWTGDDTRPKVGLTAHSLAEEVRVRLPRIRPQVHARIYNIGPDFQLSAPKTTEVPVDSGTPNCNLLPVGAASALTLFAPPLAEVRPRKLFIAFATNDYRGLRDRLNCPIPNANTLASTLKTYYGFTPSLYFDQNDRTVKRTVYDWLQKAQPDDQIIFFISGHGTSTTRPKDFYFAFKDSPAGTGYLTDYTSMGDMVQWVDNLASRKVLFLVDSCFGGSIDPRVAGFIPTKGRKSEDREIARFFIASSGTRMTTDSDGAGKPSSFTAKLTDFLVKRAKQAAPSISYYELVAEMKRRHPDCQTNWFGTCGEEAAYELIPIRH